MSDVPFPSISRPRVMMEVSVCSIVTHFMIQQMGSFVVLNKHMLCSYGNLVYTMYVVHKSYVLSLDWLRTNSIHITHKNSFTYKVRSTQD